VLASVRERLRESRNAFRAVFTNPDLRRLELSWAAGVPAYWAFIVALAVYAYDKGGATAVGVVGLIRILPAIVAGPVAGVLADRYSRERVLFGVSLARAASTAVVAAALFADAPPWLVYVLAAGVAITSSAVRPAQSALLPALASTPEELTAANLSLTTIESSGIFLGPALGGILLAATSAEVVFAAAAAALLAAALLLGRIRDVSPERQVAGQGMLRDVFTGFGTIARDEHLRLIIGLYGAQTLVAGALNVLIVVSALDLLDLGESGVGFLNSAVGVGGLLGAAAAIVLVGRRRLASDFGLGLALWGIPIGLIGVFPQPPVALFLLGIVGVGNTIVDVAAVTLLQRTVPDEVLSRVFGVVQSVFVGTLGLGAILAPLLIAGIGIRGALIATGVLLPVLAALLWRRISALDAEALAPPELDLLRSVPIFRPLPPASLEQLASDLIAVTATAGTEIIRQGEAGDRFYVIGSGEVEVITDERPAVTLGQGEYFGEIALLRDVPRTATVTAKTDVELHALERDHFLSAVTGHPASAEAVNAVIANRLAGLRPGVASV